MFKYSNKIEQKYATIRRGQKRFGRNVQYNVFHCFSPVRYILIHVLPCMIYTLHVLVYLNAYPIKEHCHILRQSIHMYADSSNTRAYDRNGLVHGVLNVFLNLQKGLFALAHFRHDVAFHQHCDVVQSGCDVWQLEKIMYDRSI